MANEIEQTMLNGRVYKLTNPNCTRCYVGSSKSKYLSIRMAHHREKHRKGLQNFYGLFDGGDPNVEVLEEVQFPIGCEWMLREREQYWSDQNKENRINIRKCYVSPRSKKLDRDRRIKKYHQSEKGRLALRKGAINHKLKNTAKPVTGVKRANLLKELEEINLKQNELRSSYEGKLEVPQLDHQDQFDAVLSDTE
tara:strand:+ start:2690 stop:3274 length:585 start_codon:yes stop_codon:yes gene_type:complete